MLLGKIPPLRVLFTLLRFNLSNYLLTIHYPSDVTLTVVPNICVDCFFSLQNCSSD